MTYISVDIDWEGMVNREEVEEDIRRQMKLIQNQKKEIRELEEKIRKLEIEQPQLAEADNSLDSLWMLTSKKELLALKQETLTQMMITLTKYQKLLAIVPKKRKGIFFSLSSMVLSHSNRPTKNEYRY